MNFTTLKYWCEGFFLLGIILIGMAANLLSVIIIRNRELSLIQDFSRLLQSLAVYDICYLILNLPVFVVPALGKNEFSTLVLYSSPYILPLIQICLTGSCYTTIGLAFERLNAMKIRAAPSRGDVYPTDPVIATILGFSILYNVPRFFELTVINSETTLVEKVNDTGNPLLDHQLVKIRQPVLKNSNYFGNDYFLYYTHLSSFIIIIVIPLLSLMLLNWLIWSRLQEFQRVALRLGKQQRKTIRATISLIAIIGIFVVCNSVKLVANGYQVSQYVRLGELPETWPAWVENSTILSHLLLAINASVNLLLYCSCDKHFWVITQKTLKKWFVWPFTMRMEMTRIDSVTEVAKPGPQTMTTEL